MTADQTGGGSLTLEIPSPDLRQDDKPRLDRPFVVPSGATVYRTAISTQNLSSSGTDTVSVDGLTTAGIEASLAASSGVLDEEGAVSPFDGFTTLSSESSDATISVTYTGELNIINPDDQAIVMVEVCYWLDGAAPDADDYPVQYKVEAGQGY